MKKLIHLSFLAFLCFSVTASAQSNMGGGRVINMRAHWGGAKGYIEPFKVDLNSELNRIYLNTKEGPYYGNTWFNAKVETLKGDIIDDEQVVFRFDIYQHELHFKTLGEEQVSVLPPETYKRFTLMDAGEEKQFVKIMPPLSSINPNVKFYEWLNTNQSYKLFKLYYANLDSYTDSGPANDGRVKHKFKRGDMYFLEVGNGQFRSVKPKAKFILIAEAGLKDDLSAFEKANGKVKSEEDLIEFLDSL